MRRPTPIWLLAITLICFCHFASAQPACFGLDLRQAIRTAPSNLSPKDAVIKKKRPGIIFVKAGGIGNGQSWASATGDLQNAIDRAPRGTQIWVATGTYFPTAGNDRNMAFRLKDAVSLFGGFSGWEKTFGQRDPSANPTVLSGEIGTRSLEDNSFTIVYAKNISRQTIIDGFTIRGGFANGTDLHVSAANNGAAWFNVDASPTISNCVFRQNTAREGAAIYNYAQRGKLAAPHIINCSFIENQADLDGGAIFNNSDFGNCSPEIENCLFKDNLATYGAGIMNHARGGVTKVSISQCIFINNKSLVKGSAIYNHYVYPGVCTASTKNCTYQNNLSTFGEDVSAFMLYTRRD